MTGIRLPGTWRWGLLTGLLMALVVGPRPARSEHPSAKVKAESDNEKLGPLIEGLGTHEHQIATDKPLAQKYFDQGLRLIFAFNHDEAIRAFRSAAKVDPNAAMAQWGIALALGPNYNLAADPERSKAAYEASRLAQKLAAKTSPREAAYADALAQRYAESPDAERKPLDQAYADAMRKLAAQYPDNLDAAVLFAEALMDVRPWDLWTHDGQAQPGTDEIVATLERVLGKAPNHPGANHFYIHAVEASPAPERGLAAADRLGGLMPAAGHMIHMPAHIYLRLGRYEDAAECNRRAIKADRQYIEKYRPEGVYPMMYYPHNIHFLWFAAMMEGRSGEANTSAAEVTKMIPDEMVREMPMIEAFVPTRLYALARFGKWDEVLASPRPPADFTYADGMWRYARGLALAAQTKLDGAEIERQALAEVLKATPEDKMAMRHSAAGLLTIAEKHLSAAIDAQRGQNARAIETLTAAIALEDALQYDEPPAWYFPLRQALGAALLDAKRPLDAEAAYREELKRHPVNGWSLNGLARALQAQNRAAEAAEVRQRLAKAWAMADFKLD